MERGWLSRGGEGAWPGRSSGEGHGGITRWGGLGCQVLQVQLGRWHWELGWMENPQCRDLDQMGHSQCWELGWMEGLQCWKPGWMEHLQCWKPEWAEHSQ